MKTGLKELYDINHLIASFYKTKEGTDWKESVQRYEMNLIQNICRTSQEIQDGKYKFMKQVEFKLCERGHVRYIKSHHISDRVVLTCFVDYVLLPHVRSKLIYDNAASIKGKGTSFCRRRLCCHLNDFYKRYGNKGFIRIYDFSKYFDNIDHDLALNAFRKDLNDDEYEFLTKVYREFEFDLSFLSDEEYEKCKRGMFNSLLYFGHPKSERTGEKMLRKSVGIGSPVSQTTGVFYPHRLDNLCKIVYGIKWYGRYMDDFYIIAQTKEELDYYHSGIELTCKELGIILNKKKIKTIPLNREFVFLKTIYRLRDDGKIVKRMCKCSLLRERRKIRKYRNLIEQGKMTADHVIESYRGWRGSYKNYNSTYELIKMDKYIKHQLHIKEDIKWTKKTKQ